MKQTQLWMSPQEYLDQERLATTKSEYFNGEVYALAGASPRHTAIAANVIAALHARFKGRPCTVHTGDLRVKVSPTGLYTYPDVVVVCGQPKFDDAQKDTLLNPTLIVEVLSESTEAYDRGRKFDHYRRIESLTDYVLVSQESALIEHRSRQSANKWLVSFYMGLKTVVPLPTLNCELPMTEVYDKIDWPDEDSANGWMRAVKEPTEEYQVEPTRIELTALPGIPIIQPGDDLPGIILHAADKAGLAFQSGDVLVVAQKIISKAEGRLVDLQTVTPSQVAEELANASRKDPRIVELILRESTEVLRVRPDLIVVEHRGGFVCANAGIDQSNAAAPHGSTSQGPWALLLPEDSDRSAQRLRDALRTATGADIAVIISDSHGRAWRLGTVGVTIGVAGLHPLSDLRGRPDLTGRALQITEVGTADELAAAAGLLMGQAAEGTPAVLVRGATFIAGEGHLREMLRAKEKDLFR